MKQALTILLAMLTACSQDSGERTLPLGGGLESYEEVSADGQDTLRGVRRIEDGQVVVPPGRFASFTVEEDVIRGTKPGDDYVWAFTLAGQPIGRFDLLSHWREDSANYY